MIARLARGIITCPACVLFASQRGSNVFTRDKAARNISSSAEKNGGIIGKAGLGQNNLSEALIESFK